MLLPPFLNCLVFLLAIHYFLTFPFGIRCFAAMHTGTGGYWRAVGIDFGYIPSSFLILGRQRIDFCNLFLFLCERKYTDHKKEASKHRFRRIGFFFLFFSTTNLRYLRPILFFFCGFLSYNYFTLFNSLFIPLIRLFLPAISPSPHSSCSLLGFVCVARPCQRLAHWGSVPTMPQAFSPGLSPHMPSIPALKGLSTDRPDAPEQISSE